MTTDALSPAAVLAATLREPLGLEGEVPALAIVLGSGLGGLAAQIEEARRVPYADIPGFAPPTVSGHAGALVAGRLAGRRVLAFAGRFHAYEGHAPAATALPVRVAHALGAPILLLSNAAGGVRRTLRSGDLMLIADQINLTWTSPLIGPVVAGETRFPDMSQPYDRALRLALREAARALGFALEEGVYLGLTGPAYETPAEVRMLERLGADATGMSTVAEVIVARALGLRVAGISLITNAAAGYTAAPVSHEEVLAVAADAASRFEAIVTEFVRRL